MKVKLGKPQGKAPDPGCGLGKPRIWHVHVLERVVASTDALARAAVERMLAHLDCKVLSVKHSGEPDPVGWKPGPQFKPDPTVNPQEEGLKLRYPNPKIREIVKRRNEEARLRRLHEKPGKVTSPRQLAAKKKLRVKLGG